MQLNDLYIEKGKKESRGRFGQQREILCSCEKNEEIRAKKKMFDTPVRAQVWQNLEKYEITSATYHGGELNEVFACC
jgi:hypothetical protein